MKILLVQKHGEMTFNKMWVFTFGAQHQRLEMTRLETCFRVYSELSNLHLWTLHLMCVEVPISFSGLVEQKHVCQKIANLESIIRRILFHNTYNTGSMNHGLSVHWSKQLYTVQLLSPQIFYLINVIIFCNISEQDQSRTIDACRGHVLLSWKWILECREDIWWKLLYLSTQCVIHLFWIDANFRSLLKTCH